MRDPQDLRPKDATELLALAGMAIRAREAQRPRLVPVTLDGLVTDEALRDAARGLLAEKRRTGGIEAVDLAELRIRDD